MSRSWRAVHGENAASRSEKVALIKVIGKLTNYLFIVDRFIHELQANNYRYYENSQRNNYRISLFKYGDYR